MKRNILCIVVLASAGCAGTFLPINDPGAVRFASGEVRGECGHEGALIDLSKYLGHTPWPADIAVDDDRVYVLASSGEVVALDKDGTNPVVLARGPEDGYELVVGTDAVYWSTRRWFNTRAYYWHGRAQIHRVPKSGGDADTIANSDELPMSLTLDATHLYWNDRERIYRVHRGGGPRQLLVEHDSILDGFAVDDHAIYWIEGNNDLYRARKDGTDAELFASNVQTWDDNLYQTATHLFLIDAESRLVRTPKTHYEPEVLLGRWPTDPGEWYELQAWNADVARILLEAGATPRGAIDATSEFVSADQTLVKTARPGRCESAPKP